MITFKELAAKGIPVLDTYKLPLNKHPLVVIRGRNLNKNQKQIKNVSNGSGKTLSVSPLPTVIYDSTPTSLKKKGTKDLLKKKNSTLELRLNNGEDIKIKQILTSSVKHTIQKGENTLHYRKAEDAKAEIRKIFPLTEEQFYSQIYIDGRERSILQKGTSAQRFAYLESIFRFNDYDKWAALVSKDYKELKAKLQELHVILEEKNTKAKNQPIFDIVKVKRKQKLIEEEIQTISSKVETYLETIQSTKIYLSIVEDLKTQASFQELKEALAESLKEKEDLTKLYRKSVKHYEGLEQKLEIKNRRKKVIAKINAIEGDVEDLSKYKKKLGISDDMMYLATEIANIESNKKKYEELKDSIKEYKFSQHIKDRYSNKTLTELEKLHSRLGFQKQELAQSIANLKDYLEQKQEHKHEDPTCPVCQRGLSLKTARVLHQNLREKQHSVKVKRETLTVYIQYRKIEEDMKNLDFSGLEEKEALYKKMEARLEKYKEIVHDLERKKELLDLLENLPKVTIYEDNTIPKPFVYEDTIGDLDKRVRNIENDLAIHRRLKRLAFEFENVERAKFIYEKTKAKIAKYRPMLQELQSDLNKYISKTSVFETIQNDITRLNEKIDVLKLETKDAKILEALRKAFGSRGLRKIKMMYYLKQLEANFNKYTHLIYGEPIKFSFQATETKLDILAEMNGSITDVRRLSGAESSAFTVLLILCVLPYIPTEYRANLLIFDEIESGFDEYSKELLLNKFLPVLQQIVPNIIFITPQSEKAFYLPNAVTYLVTKQGRTSTIKQIHSGNVKIKVREKGLKLSLNKAIN